MSEHAKLIEVEVAYALPHKQKIYALNVAEGTTALAAAKQSPLTKDFAEVDLDSVKIGIFGQSVKKPNEHVLNEHDRVEVYRDLIADPKEARRKRAAKSAGES